MITGQTLRDAILSGANNIANQRTRVTGCCVRLGNRAFAARCWERCFRCRA